MNITSLTLKDGASTPKDHIFAPRNPQSLNGKDVIPARWSEPGTVMLLDKAVTLSQSVNGNKTSITRGQLKVPSVIPAADGCCTSDAYFDGLFSFDFRIPPLYTTSQRADLLALAISLLGQAVVSDAVLKGEVVY